MNKNRSLLIVAAILLISITIGAWYLLGNGERRADTTSKPGLLENEQSKTTSKQIPENLKSTQQATTQLQSTENNAAASRATNAKNDPTTSLRVPTFDVLRVEPDGNAVIAGAAEPLGLVEVKEEKRVLATSDAAITGDFVAILDNPLPPGDHQIHLNVSMPDGRTTRSLQTATISIPDGENGELLALITEPGKASEIITAPELTGANAADQPITDATKRDTNTNNDPQKSTEVTRLSPVIVNADGERTETQAVTAIVSIKAVEIEGGMLFIAGEGVAGSTVYGYIDDNFLTESAVNTEGNYVIEAKRQIPVGLHTIRVDMHNKEDDIIARASVPFDRPVGEQVAAISNTSGSVSEKNPDGTQTFVQPQLMDSDNAVIIRRGDNLWRISRRLYGRGVRYTTIYLANEAQILNPDMIEPGQIFSIPNEPLPIEEAETIHRRLLNGMPIGSEYHLPAGDN